MAMIICGTRPEIVKMSPIVKECDRLKLDYFILHTGQHYSENLDEVFFEQLGLPAPKYNLKVGSGTHAEQIGKMLMGIEKVLLDEKPDAVLVEGDTNSAIAGALAAVKLHIKVGHVEAGLRSYDRRMPEEINRILADHCSDYLFTPTERARRILLKEGIGGGKVFVTGNTIVDAIRQNLDEASRRATALDIMGLEAKGYILATVHRPENVDDSERFSSILKGLELVAAKVQLPVVYPVHPRSWKMMSYFNIEPRKAKWLHLIMPLDYFNFLSLEANAKLIMTDSGGIQEEACVIHVPCVTLRDNTERPETIEVGANILAGTDADRIVECAVTMSARRNSWANPFGDGKAGERIVGILAKG